LFGPTIGNIDKIDGVDGHTGGEIAATSDRVGFKTVVSL
jgi:hypothetical protein